MIKKIDDIVFVEEFCPPDPEQIDYHYVSPIGALVNATWLEGHNLVLWSATKWGHIIREIINVYEFMWLYRVNPNLKKEVKIPDKWNLIMEASRKDVLDGIEEVWNKINHPYKYLPVRVVETETLTTKKYRLEIKVSEEEAADWANGFAWGTNLLTSFLYNKIKGDDK